MAGFLRTITDGLFNAITGAGTTQDKRAHAMYSLRYLDWQQVHASYRDSWIMRKIVDLPAIDMTRAGRDWQADESDIEKLETSEATFGLWDKLRKGVILGRLGGGAIIVGASGNPDTVMPASPGALRYLHVVSRHQLAIGRLVTDLESPWYGQPEYFELHGTGQRARIHPSRVIVFHGMPVLSEAYASEEDRFWGDPVYRIAIDAVQNAETALNGFASLIDEAKYDILGIPDLMTNVAEPGYEERLQKRLAIATVGKSMHRTLVRDAAETWETRSVSWTGMPDVIRTYISIPAGVSDIPATRFLGKSPDGMNATGDGDEANYLAMIEGQQSAVIAPALAMIDPLLKAHAKASPDAWYKFAPIKVMSEAQQAEIALKKSQMVTAYANNGTVPIDVLAITVPNMLEEDGTFPGLMAAIEEAATTGEEMPDDPDNDPSALTQPDLASVADAKPRSLYVRRDVKNAAEILAWAKSQGFDETLTADDLHVTVLFSRAHVDWMRMDEDWRGNEKGELIIPEGGARIVEPLGDKGAVVLLFNSSQLAWRHEQMVRMGASHDYGEYQPHVTITYKGAGVDLAKVKPYRGRIVLGPEIFEELDLDWSPKAGK